MKRVALVVLLLGGVAMAGDENPRPWMGFPAYPGGQRLCGPERVYGIVMEIHWESYVSTDAPAKVVAFFEKDHGAKAKRVGKTFEIRDKKNDDLVLTVYPVSEAANMPSCAKKPAAGDQTAILVSVAYRHPDNTK